MLNTFTMSLTLDLIHDDHDSDDEPPQPLSLLSSLSILSPPLRELLPYACRNLRTSDDDRPLVSNFVLFEEESSTIVGRRS